MDDAEAARRGAWLHTPWFLALVIVGVYALSLGGPWLEYDDDWLVRDNELLNLRDLSVLTRIVGGFDRETRLVLGAEYLPARDLVTWIGRGWLGLDALGFRVLSLAIYVTACTALLAWAHAVSSPAPDDHARQARARTPLALAVWIFALHPIHAESVAWIAGLKDVLALLFVALALLFHARGGARDRGLAVVCVFLACASKSVAVVLPALLLLVDVCRQRRVDRVVVGASSAIALGWIALHAWVGTIVGMYAAPLGEDPITRFASVTVVSARYVALSFGVHPESVIYEVDTHALDATSVISVTGFVVVAALGALAWRRGRRWPLVSLAWFLIALLPTSQLVAPLQNRMADRYLLVAVLGPAVIVAFALHRASRRIDRRIAEAVLVGTLALVASATALRARTFADPIALFVEATQRTERSANPPSLLGGALMNARQYADAENAYRLALARDRFETDHGRRDGNSLGQLLAGLGRLDESRALYAALVEHYPDDPRVLHNLAVMEAETGRDEDAARHREELARRFPDYRSGTPDRPGPL